MTDPLEKYRNKRDPSATREPFGAEHTVRAADSWAGRFVIHQHAASRMHYDLRLEISGTLQSFAIPKGISLDPDEKHLAVHTENHPLEYLFFEDLIPEGNYGAGAMIVWDTGRFVFLEADGEESLKRGKLDFVLSGFKAKGRFALIATGRRKAAQGLAGTSGKAAEWLFIKKRDEHAQPEVNLIERHPHSVLSGLTVSELRDKKSWSKALEERARALLLQYPPARPSDPFPFPPMVVKHGDAPKVSSNYLYELKLDGVRILAQKSRHETSLVYRSLRVCTRNYSEIARCVAHIPVDELLLDGEIVTFDEQGRPNFGRLAPRIQAKKAADIVQAEHRVPVVFFVFDLLKLGQYDLYSVPLEQRKALLFELIRGNGYVRTLDHILGRGDALWALCESQDLEGMVAKRLSTSYVPGPQASGDWLKLKRARDYDYVVVGFTQSSRGEFKALLLALKSEEGWVYQGRVGTGFSNRDRINLAKLLDGLRRDTAALVVPEMSNVSFVDPKLVVKIKHLGLGNSGHVRGASFQGIHEAKQPDECVISASYDTPEEQSKEAEQLLERPQEATNPRPGLASTHLAQLSNLEKVYFPEEGFTKGDLINYYASIAPYMLPHLKGRPVVLVRYPDGILGKSFYQWRAPEKTPSWLRTFELYDEEKQKIKGSNKSAFLVDHLDALLHIANLGCIPLHVLASREGSADCCDFLTIDFDLGPRTLSDGVRLALSLREILDELGLIGFVKTSGQRGLHVLVPLGPGINFQSAKLLCELLGRILLTRHSDIATMQRRIEKRGDKVYIDTGQTGRSRTIVAPYSVRAFPGARVSTPLTWNEVHLALDPANFTIETVPSRVELTDDPMLELLEVRPAIPAILNKLASWMGPQLG